MQRLVEEINMSQRSQMRLDELHVSLCQMLQDLQKDATVARAASLTLTALAGGPPAAGAHLLYWYKSTCLLVQILIPEELQCLLQYHLPLLEMLEAALRVVVRRGRVTLLGGGGAKRASCS